MVEEALIVVVVKFKCIQPLKSNKSLVNDYLTLLVLLLFSENGRRKQIKRQWRVCYFEDNLSHFAKNHIEILNISKIAVSVRYYLCWITKSNFIQKMSSFKRISALSVRRTYSPACWICLLCIKCEGCRFFIAKCISYVV